MLPPVEVPLRWDAVYICWPFSINSSSCFPRSLCGENLSSTLWNLYFFRNFEVCKSVISRQGNYLLSYSYRSSIAIYYTTYACPSVLDYTLRLLGNYQYILYSQIFLTFRARVLQQRSFSSLTERPLS